MTLCLLGINRVKSLGFNQLVDFSAGKSGEHLLGKAVVNGLSLLPLLVLEEVHGLESCGTTNELVRELGLMWLAIVQLIPSGLGVV